MAEYLGDFASGSTLNFKFTTVGTTGAPTTFIGSTAISCFKDVGTTSLLSTTNSAITLSVDFITVTGLHHVRITTASDLTFFSTSSDFQVVVAGGTVGGTSIVGYTPAHFSIENRSALRPTTAGRTLDISSGGEAGVDWANVGSPTTTVALTGTTISGISNATALASTIANATWDTTLAAHLNTGSTGAALNAAGSAGDPWSTAIPGVYGAGTAGNIVGNYVNTPITNMLAPTVAGRTLDVTATGTAGVDWANVENATTAVNLSATNIDTDQVVASVSGAVGSVTGAVGSVTGLTAANLDTTVSSRLAPTVAARTLDVTATGTAGIDLANVEGQSTELILSATTISGISNTVRVGSNADKTGYTMASGGIGSGAHAAAELNAIADGLLDRNMTTGTDSGTDSTVFRTMRQALRALRNKVTRSGDTMTVRKEDDTTSSWTAGITSAVANALTEVDPS